jgi:hypothetical protein
MNRLIAFGLFGLAPLFVIGEPARAQAFTNLDFQSGSFSEDTLSGVFPGWSFTPTGIGATFLFPHLSSLPQRHLVDNAGDFSLYMMAGEVPTNPEWTAFEFSDMTISQTGFVPAATKSITLQSTSSPDPYFLFATTGELAWQLTLDGSPISMTNLGGGSWGANIPSFANSMATLEITMNRDYHLGMLDWPWSQFDDIEFSTQSIPEPASLGLAVAALGIAAISKRLR